MHIIWILIIGLVIGALAKLIMPGKDPGGVLITIALGIAGSVAAHLIGEAGGWYASSEPAGFFASVIGAVAVLAVYRAIVGRKKAIV